MLIHEPFSDMVEKDIRTQSQTDCALALPYSSNSSEHQFQCACSKLSILYSTQGQRDPVSIFKLSDNWPLSGVCSSSSSSLSLSANRWSIRNRMSFDWSSISWNKTIRVSLLHGYKSAGWAMFVSFTFRKRSVHQTNEEAILISQTNNKSF